METATGHAEEGGKPWQELGQVAEAWDSRNEGAGGLGLVGDVQWHPEIP